MLHEFEALLSAGLTDAADLSNARPGDILHLEGEVVGLTPSKTKPQGVALVSWTLYNQNGEAVYSFTPIAIVPRRPQPSEAS